MKSSLEGIRVLDLTQIMAGPFCTMLLADLGADVIKIEKPAGGDDSRRMGEIVNGESAAFLTLNRNKRGIVLDLRTEQGKDVLWRLIAVSDVLVENFRPGTMSKLGFDYESVHLKHPQLVYCSISGFGQTGPWRDRGGFDLVAQAMSGVLSVTGTPETPTKVGVPISDLNAGLFASHAILAALYNRQHTGVGQYIETSLLEAAMAYTIWESNEHWVTGHVPQRLGTAHRASAPYQVFPTSDGFIAIGAANQRTWEKLTQALNRPDLRDDPMFLTNRDRMSHIPQLVEALTEVLSRKTTDEWLNLLDKTGVPAGPVLSVDQVYQHPQVIARNMNLQSEHPTAGTVHTIGFPVKYSDTPATLRSLGPVLGQHTSEVLAEIGFTKDQIDNMIEQGVIVPV
ncbi:CaiB/BaiF CoA transferase family protein [Alicyclobacillus ferrooxydans]|uniref:CaiB/BaiF CoA transferase family protein n=1 Tax=Alicyclobacillus ferrooxydans TaxID=471514 RepID=UPI000A44A11B|nr:CoA transferase [Alicyclobacillus ferrooxydans]